MKMTQSWYRGARAIRRGPTWLWRGLLNSEGFKAGRARPTDTGSDRLSGDLGPEMRVRRRASLECLCFCCLCTWRLLC